MRRTLLALGLTAATFAPHVEAVEAVEAAPARAAQPLPAIPGSVSADLAAVPVDATTYRSAKARYDQTADALNASATARTAAEAELARLAAEDASLTARIAVDTEAKQLATTELATVRNTLRVIAVTSYIRGNKDEQEADVDTSAGAAELFEADARRIVFGTLQSGQLERARAAQARFDETSRRLDDGIRQREAVRTRSTEVTADRDAAANDEIRLTAELAQRAIELEEARVTATVVGADFALVAMDAYYRGAGALGSISPTCGVAWWALAGITRVESKHGRAAGSELLANGDTTRPIIGIPLDGTNGTALIPDSDGGEMDGDLEYDRAVGPMQFIPSTWRRWAADGNHDGRVDPHNMYDAALSAARYLCAGGPMQTDEDMIAGFLRYNHSSEYADTVLAHAHEYATIVIPSTA